MDEKTRLLIQLVEADIQLRYWQEIARAILRNMPTADPETYHSSDEQLAYRDGVKAQSALVTEMMQAFKVSFLPPIGPRDDNQA
jgi:hypothetical protein